MGSRNYQQAMKQIFASNIEEVNKRSLDSMFSDIDVKKHGDYVVDFLQDEHKFDKDYVSTELLKTSAHQLMRMHYTKNLDKDFIHHTYKKVAKPKEAEAEAQSKAS